MHHPVLATVITQSQKQVQMKHSPEHLEDLILTLASELFLVGDWFKLATYFHTFYCDPYFLFQI